MPFDPAPSRKLLDQLLGLAKKAAPGAAARVSVRATHTGFTRFAQNQVTASGDVDEVTVQVEIAVGQRHAGASMNQTDDASLRELVARAARLARLAPEDPEYMPPLGAQKYLAVKGAYDPATDGMSAATRAQAVAGAVGAGQAQKLAVAGFYSHAGHSLARADSAGLSAYHKWTEASFTCTARTADGTGSGWAGDGGHRSADLDAAATARLAVAKAVSAAHPRPLQPGHYTVILEPAAVAGLGVFLPDSLDAREADEGRSFFARPGGGNRVGETIFGPGVTLRSDPTDVALGAVPFDEEGLPFAPVSWIDKGKLTGLLYTRFWARKQGKPATGYPGAWQLAGGTTPRAELLKGVKRGVLISRFFYTGLVDPQSVLVTGMTRDGVFLVENGEIVAPVNNFRWSASPVTMLQNVEAMSPAEVAQNDFGYFMRVPALRTADFNLASVSEAV